MQTTELLRQKMLSVFPVPVSSYCIIDSFPLAVCKFGRARYCKTFRSQGLITESALLKRKLTSAIKCMPWSHQKVTLLHLRLRRHPQMTVKDYGIWWVIVQILQFQQIKDMLAKNSCRKCRNKRSVFLHSSVPTVKKTGQKLSGLMHPFG